MATEKSKKLRAATIEKREQNRQKVQIEILKAYIRKTPRGYGFCMDGVSTYFMVGTEILYKIPNSKFLLDPKKLTKTRLIRVNVYKELFEQSKSLKKVHYRKKIRGETFSVFRLGDKQICVPANRLSNFGWKGNGFYGINEYSPVFVTDGHEKGWKRVQGFVMPVEVSLNILKEEKGNE